MSALQSVEFEPVYFEPHDVTIVHVHGAGLGPEHAEPTTAELIRLGYHDIVNPRLPIENLGLTADDDTEVVYDKVKDKERLFFLFNSRGLETFRIFKKQDILHKTIGALAYGCAGPHQFQFEPDTPESKWPRYTHEFEEAIVRKEGYTEYDPDLVSELFFPGNGQQARFVAACRKQRNPSPEKDSPFPRMRNLPFMFIYNYSNGDKVINVRRARAMAKKLFGVEPVEIDGGHLPQTNESKYFANHVVRMLNFARFLKLRPNSPLRDKILTDTRP